MQNNIKKIRKSEKISQKKLAKFLHTTQQAISYMENNDIKVEPKKMKKIATFLNKDVVEVFPECKLLK